MRCPGLLLDASTRRLHTRAPRTSSRPPSPRFLVEGAPELVYSHCSWRFCRRPQHRSCWSSRSCPTSWSWSRWHSPRPAGGPAAGCQRSLRWLNENREKRYRDKGTLLGSTQASSFRPFLPWVAVTYVVNLWRLESPHWEEYSGMVWNGMEEMPPLLPSVPLLLTARVRVLITSLGFSKHAFLTINVCSCLKDGTSTEAHRS